MPRNNSYSKSFYWRNGLKIMPSQNFIDKFKVFYNELLYQSKQRLDLPPLDDDTAIFFINIVLENIITILDFGYDFWWKRMLVLTQKITAFHLGTPNAPKRMCENVKKLSFRLITKQQKIVKKFLNQNNERYVAFLESKKERYNQIKDYYKELYGKQNDWWLESNIQQ